MGPTSGAASGATARGTTHDVARAALCSTGSKHAAHPDDRTTVARVRVARPPQDEIEGERRDQIYEEPALKVVLGDLLARIDPHTALVHRRAEGQEEHENDVTDKNEIDEPIADEQPVPRGVVVEEADLERGDERSVAHREEDENVPVLEARRERVDRPFLRGDPDALSVLALDSMPQGSGGVPACS